MYWDYIKWELEFTFSAEIHKGLIDISDSDIRV